VVDAQIAPVTMAHGGTVYTANQNSRRFRGLRCKFPQEAQGTVAGRFVTPSLQRSQESMMRTCRHLSIQRALKPQEIECAPRLDRHQFV
jgi:hypothetical protein